MAGRSVLLHLVQQRVAVTVQVHGHDPLGVAAGRSLAPQLLAGTAVVVGVATGERGIKRLPVRPGQHEYLSGPRVLDDYRQQPVVSELYLGVSRHAGDDIASAQGSEEQFHVMGVRVEVPRRHLSDLPDAGTEVSDISRPASGRMRNVVAPSYSCRPND